MREVQISIVAQQETEELVNKLLKKKQRDWNNIGVDMQPEVEMRHHKNVNEVFLNLDQKIQTLPPSLHLLSKYLISRFFLLLYEKCWHNLPHNNCTYSLGTCQHIFAFVQHNKNLLEPIKLLDIQLITFRSCYTCLNMATIVMV